MTISLENAKKLKEVAEEKGVTLPESENIHFLSKELEKKHYYNEHGQGYDIPDGWTVNAYTTDELLKWLPETVLYPNNPDIGLLFELTKDENNYQANYGSGLFYGEAETPADALCLLAIKLIKEGIIK